MSDGQWMKAPGNPAADRWVTRDCRRVLVVVPHLTAGVRLGDLVPLLEADHRVQVQFTVPESDDAWPDAVDYVRGAGGAVLPWHQALRTTFDLALDAGHVEADRIAAPVLVVPHGAGGPAAGPGAAAVVVAHEADAERLRAGCPEAADRVVVAGDPCYDRITASKPYRDRYRAALGVRRDQRLVLLSSTWSRHSLFGGDRGVWDRAAAELPAAGYRVVAALHPNIWAMHGRRQVLAWLADHMAAGVDVVPPEDGWRAALVAADFVIGDHGLVTRYGAALGVPVLLNAASAADVPAGVVALLRDHCPTVTTGLRLDEQLARAAAAHRPDRSAALAARITSHPGRSATILRTTMYRLLGLPEPDRRVPVSPVPLPDLIERSPGWGRPW